MEKILVVEIAALGHEFLLRAGGGDSIGGLQFQPIESVFPALTCTVQASMRTGELPAGHGVVGNHFYSRRLRRPFFWEQSSALIEGRRIWESLRHSGRTVAQLFWQQSIGPDSDILLSPAPIHKHHGGMIPGCYSRPPGLYEDLIKQLGAFQLKHYWGPYAGIGASRWIAAATAAVMKTSSPDVLFAYLPHLDYILQREGPQSSRAGKDFLQLKALLEGLLECAAGSGYRALVFGDYAMSPVDRAVFPNRILRREGLFSVRNVSGMSYPDLHSSKAFAVADHQVAHLFAMDPEDARAAACVLEAAPGIAQVLDSRAKRERGIDHPRAGDLVLVAEKDSWFAYPWWESAREAPDYASHVDIHNKPGYDPCELFRGRRPFSISTDTSRVRGSHGLTGEGLAATWASDLDFRNAPSSLVGLARALEDVLDRK